MPGCGSCCWIGKGRTSGGDRSGAAAIVATTDALSRALTRTPHREAPGPALPHTVTAIAATRTPLHTMAAHPLARSPSPGRLPHAVAAIAATADSPPPARDGNSPRHGQRPGQADFRTRQQPSPSRQTHRHAHATAAHPAMANLPARRTPHAAAVIGATADSPPPARDGSPPRHGHFAGGSRHHRRDRLIVTRTRPQPACRGAPPCPADSPHAALGTRQTRRARDRPTPPRSRAHCVNLAVRQVPAHGSNRVGDGSLSGRRASALANSR